MYKSNMGLAPRRRQGGFIQGAILFALVIIAVVVAAFSLANQDNQTSADSEQAKINAVYVLKVGTDIQSAVNRAIADGVNPALANTQISLSDVSDGTKVGLWDPSLRYLVSEPRFPPTSLSSGTAATFNFPAPLAVTGVGGTNTEQIIEIGKISREVCRRINSTVNGVVVTANMPGSLATATSGTGFGWREGCYGTNTAGAAHTYFRVVVVDAAAPVAG